MDVWHGWLAKSLNLDRQGVSPRSLPIAGGRLLLRGAAVKRRPSTVISWSEMESRRGASLLLPVKWAHTFLLLRGRISVYATVLDEKSCCKRDL